MAGKFVSPKAKESLMTDILVKLFVKDYKDVEKVSVRTAYGVLASGVGIFCNVLLTIAKMVIGILLHSVSVTADAFNNLSDAGSSIIGMIGVKMAEKPADKEQKAAIADAVKNVRRAIKSRDPAQMVSSADVLEQLLSNALKYTRVGSIRIYLQNGRTLWIADTGIGIAPEDLPRIFEKGFTGAAGRAEQSASGLGLYLCRRICAALNIAIRAESTLGAGTTVFLTLPDAPGRAE